MLLLVLLLFSWMVLVLVVCVEFLRACNFDYVRVVWVLGMNDCAIMSKHVFEMLVFYIDLFL